MLIVGALKSFILDFIIDNYSRFT